MVSRKSALSALLVAITAVGCGKASGPELSTLKGHVTLNGAPLGKARVIYQPASAGGSPSFAETAADGSYELKFNRDRIGVLLGLHRISVTTYRVEEDQSGKETVVLESLPPKYNEKTELSYEVQPGANVFDLKLEAQAR